MIVVIVVIVVSLYRCTFRWYLMLTMGYINRMNARMCVCARVRVRACVCVCVCVCVARSLSLPLPLPLSLCACVRVYVCVCVCILYVLKDREWQVGLASAPKLAGPWTRMPWLNPASYIERPEGIENPIVTRTYANEIAIPPAFRQYQEATDGRPLHSA